MNKLVLSHPHENTVDELDGRIPVAPGEYRTLRIQEDWL